MNPVLPLILLFYIIIIMLAENISFFVGFLEAEWYMKQ